MLTRKREGVIHGAWQGPAHLSFGARSELDPWHRLPVRRVITAYHVRGDSTLLGGQVIEECWPERRRRRRRPDPPFPAAASP